MNLFKLFLLIALVASITSCTKVYVHQDMPQISEELFQSSDILKVTILSDLKTLLNDRGNDRMYHSGSIMYHNKEKGEISLPVELKVRGNFKRRPANCDFPPLKIKFNPAEVAATAFEGQDELKLFTHCRSEDENYEQALLKEYFIYKMYNQLADVSISVRLLEVSYADKEGKTDPLVRYAFLIESQAELEARLGGQIVKMPEIQPDQVDAEAANRLAVFQYMIGNEDWAISPPHNVLMLKKNSSQSLQPIPYDFDFSDLVHTIDFQSEQITQSSRQFQGYCRTTEEFEKSFQLFREKKISLDKMIENTKLLTEHQQKGVLKYLETFYAAINDPEKVKLEFLDKCKTHK